MRELTCGMRITIFGITGYTGGNLARELRERGHEVVGVARTAGDGVDVVGSVFDPDVVARAAAGADAIVSAVNFVTDGSTLVHALPGLLATAEREGARLGVVGGASSLTRGPGGPLVLDAIPDEWRPEVEAGMAVLDALRVDAGPVDWFYLSPSEVYGAWAAGERTGTFRLGDDELLVAPDGSSTISGADYAIAFADELETPAHHRARFTVGY